MNFAMMLFATVTLLGQHDEDYERPGRDAPQSPSEVVQALADAAAHDQEALFRYHLTWSFQEGVARLQHSPVGDDGTFAWPVFMGAVAADPIVAVEHNQFFERASVRATTQAGKTIKFDLALEDGRWRVKMPAGLAEQVKALEPPPAADTLEDDAATAPDESPGPGPVAVVPAEEDLGTPPVIAPAPAPRTDDDNFFAYGRPGHYVWYLPDYLFLAGSGALIAASELQLIRPPWVLIGPDYRPGTDEPKDVLDPRLDTLIGRPYLQEQISPYAILGAGVAGAIALGGIGTIRHRDFHHPHAFVLGAATATMLALDLTTVLKNSVGRLRPDFRDRYLRSACAGYTEAPASLDCTGATEDGFTLTNRDVIDGMRSFPSGHASSSFALATYFSLYLGGEWIWGDGANAVSMPLAALASGGMLAAAGYVAASRVTDNRHHLEDVAVGSAIGVGSAAASYLLHFDLDGHARVRSWSLSTLPVVGQGGGLALSGSF